VGRLRFVQVVDGEVTFPYEVFSDPCPYPSAYADAVVSTSLATERDYEDAKLEHIGRLRLEGPFEHRYEINKLPSAGSYDDEEIYDMDADEYRRGRLVVICPNCGENAKPLLSKKTFSYDGGWGWVGLDHKEPYSWYWTQHTCGHDYRFKLVTPQ
jgi:hypothetical protein